MAGKSPEERHPVKTRGWAARDSSRILSPFKFSRRLTMDHCKPIHQDCTA